MTNRPQEPSSAPVTLNGKSSNDQHEDLSGTKGRQEPRSDPTNLQSKLLDCLNEEQLRKLTKANTRKNLGGRTSRLRSQVERVCRRLDNLAADVRLQPRFSLVALPIITPDDLERPSAKDVYRDMKSMRKASSSHNDVKRPRPITQTTQFLGQHLDGAKKEAKGTSAPERLDPMLLENDEFDIEPATNNSVFSESCKSLGTTPRSSRSVRISSEVTVLDSAASSPLSVTQLRRCEHPTRSGKSLQAQKGFGNDMSFPRALQNLELNQGADASPWSGEMKLPRVAK